MVKLIWEQVFLIFKEVRLGMKFYLLQVRDWETKVAFIASPKFIIGWLDVASYEWIYSKRNVPTT